MSKIAFLYPGQGSQKVGMGHQLLKEAPELFNSYLVRSGVVADAPIARYCLEGPAEELNQTNIAQPALFAYSLALTDYAHRLGLYPDMVAGHSLGEYTAAVAAGALTFEDGLYLVTQRGRLMREIQDKQPGVMAAVQGFSPSALQELCNDIAQKHFVMVANINSPKQIVVSGVEAGVAQLMETVRAQGGRAVSLTAGGAFHTPLMAPAQHALAEVMHELTWCRLSMPLVGNVTGQPISHALEVRDELIEQITNPVRWVSCIETLIASGCDIFVELGPAQVLTRLVRAIAPEVETFNVESPRKIAELAEKRLVLQSAQH